MRINSISNSYALKNTNCKPKRKNTPQNNQQQSPANNNTNNNTNNNISFGRFLDEKAKQLVTKQVLKTVKNHSITPEKGETIIQTIEEAPFVDVYTSRYGSLKVKFDSEQLKKYPCKGFDTLDEYREFYEELNGMNLDCPHALYIDIKLMEYAMEHGCFEGDEDDRDSGTTYTSRSDDYDEYFNYAVMRAEEEAMHG